MKEPYRKGEQRIHPGLDSCRDIVRWHLKRRSKYQWAGLLSFEKPMDQDADSFPSPAGRRGTSDESAHQGRRHEALTILREAVSRFPCARYVSNGTVDHGLNAHIDLSIENDSDLKSLHGYPRFSALVAYAKERAAAAQKPH